MRRPAPRAPVASTVPPAAATTCLTIARPSPVPRVARAASARQKRSKSRARSRVADADPVVRRRRARSTPGSRRDREGEAWRRGPRSGSRSRPGSRRRSGASAGAAAGRRAGRPSAVRVSPARVAARLELGDDLLEHGQRGRAAERDDLGAALELARGRGSRRSARRRSAPRPGPARAAPGCRRPGRSAESSRTRMRASGVRSSCETEAVKPARSSSKETSSGAGSGTLVVDGHRLARFGLDRVALPPERRSSPDRHHSDTRSAPDTALW